MDRATLQKICEIRAVVGYLGERDQYAWWQSAFFAPSSPAFLTPLFGRTQTLAQVHGVTRAAALIHDERIGVGDVYHLFRLPEDIEQAIHHILHDAGPGERLAALTADMTTALTYLRQEAGALQPEGVGPVRLGARQALRLSPTWALTAAAYWHGFEQRVAVYPYFAAESAATD